MWMLEHLHKKPHCSCRPWQKLSMINDSCSSTSFFSGYQFCRSKIHYFDFSLRDQRHVSINLLNKQEILRILRHRKFTGKKKLNTKFLASNSYIDKTHIEIACSHSKDRNGTTPTIARSRVAGALHRKIHTHTNLRIRS